jgi:hypothetical protein
MGMDAAPYARFYNYSDALLYQPAIIASFVTRHSSNLVWAMKESIL